MPDTDDWADTLDDYKQLQAARRAYLDVIFVLTDEIHKLRESHPRLAWDGVHIRTLRERRGLSKRMTARIAGVHPSTITRLEEDGYGVRIDVAWRLSRALGVTLADLTPRPIPGELSPPVGPSA